MKRKVWDITVKDNPNRVVMGENDEFYTTDTEAYLVFNLDDENFSPESAVLTLENRNDGSLKNETVNVVDGLIEWEMPQRYIEHFGNWQGQLVYEDTKDGQPELYTSATFSFVVNAHIGDKKKPSLVEIENWEKFIREGTELIETWEDLEALREENERQRVLNEQARESAEAVRVANEEERELNEAERISKDSERDSKVEAVEGLQADLISGAVDSAAVQQHVEERYEQLEEEYAPKLTEVTTQLAQKVGGGVKAEPEDLSAETLGMITGEGGPINIESVPQDYSVTPKKTSFMKKSRNLFNGEYHNWSIEEVGERFVVRGEQLGFNGRTIVVPIIPNETYTIKIHDNPSTRFAIGLSNQYPPTFDGDNFFEVEKVEYILAPTQVLYDFHNNTDFTYAYIYLSHEGVEPRVQVEKGNVATDYVEPLIIPQKMIEESERKPSNVVVEDPQLGYAPRPNLPQVIWVGANEPTEPEPFDEWREVEGFYYFSDFNEYQIGEPPRDWELQWGNDGTFNIDIDSGEKVLRYMPATTGANALSWEHLENDGKKADAEVFLRGRLGVTSDATNLAIVLRGSGNRDNATGYVVGARQNGTIRLSRYLNGGTATLANGQSNVNFVEYFNIRARIDDNRIRVKCWQHGTTEPRTWLIDITDSLIFDSGFIGLSNWLTNYNAFIDRIGVATGGGRAPQRRLI